MGQEASKRQAQGRSKIPMPWAKCPALRGPAPFDFRRRAVLSSDVQMMRILIVPVGFPSRARPSVGIAILRRAQALANLGHEVHVFTTLPLAPPLGRKWSSYCAVPEYDVVDGIPVHTARVPMLPRLIGFEYVPVLLRNAFERELDRVQPDIVHASFLLPGGQLVVRQRRIPSIVTAHGYDAYDVPYRRPGLRRACVEAVARASRVTAVSAYLARYVERLAPRHVDVIWNGADERFFYPRDRMDCCKRLGLPAERCIVAYAGHMVRAKGVFELIEATARIDPMHRPLLVLAGEGAQRAEPRDAVKNVRYRRRLFGPRRACKNSRAFRCRGCRYAA